MINGIDVSGYQRTSFVTSGLDFAWIKATEGTSYINPHQNGQAYTARHDGLVTGFYHFLVPGNFNQQADYFVNKCGSVPGDMLAVDWEIPGISCADKDSFIRTVKRLRPKHKVLLYCNTDYWLNRDITSYCGDGLWIADPSAPVGKPNIQHQWTFHQYGIRGGTDVDVSDFRSRNGLRTWAHELV